jgi:hypothetical protein
MVRFILLLMGIILGGCRYKNGVGSAANVRSIYVEPVKNSSLCHRASGTLTAQLAQAIQRSTPLKLAGKDEAHTHLQVEIIDFSQKNSAYDPKDTSITLSLTLCVIAECTLIDRDGHFLWERQSVEATMDLEKQDHFFALRDQAIPQLMERLAKKISVLLVNIW